MSSVEVKKPRLQEKFIRTDLFEENIINLLRLSLTNSAAQSPKLTEKGLEVIQHPFPICVIRNFLADPDVLKSALSELKNIKYNEKNNDLYKFKQSDDVSNMTKFHTIQQLYDCVRYECRHWVSQIYENELEETVSATFSSYKYGDRLLCHDDNCGNRYIAFILYLVDEWCEEYGGALQLFSTDSMGYPKEIVKSIIPEFNTLVLFKVTQTSFHQVSEILAKNKERITLNGWFHSSENINKNDCKLLEFREAFGSDENYQLDEYISDVYLKNENILNIKKIFRANSEIQLDSFINLKMWNEIKRELNTDSINWTCVGPPNVRKYEVADLTALPPSLKIMQNIFRSKTWFKHLKYLTSLDFVPSDDSDLTIWDIGILPTCHFEIQRWTRSCYSLIHDKNPDFHTDSLDVFLRMPLEDFENSCDKHGDDDDADALRAGHVIYVDSDSKDEECLLHVGYKMNSLSLIFRDEKTLRFTKYLDSQAHPFYQIFCTYRPWRPPISQPNLKHCDDEDETSEYSVSDDDDDDQGPDFRDSSSQGQSSDE